jgi:hypothetical protein
MDIKKILAIIAGGLAVVSFFAGNAIILLAVGIILLAVVALI